MNLTLYALLTKSQKERSSGTNYISFFLFFFKFHTGSPDEIYLPLGYQRSHLSSLASQKIIYLGNEITTKSSQLVAFASNILEHSPAMFRGVDQIQEKKIITKAF